MDFNFEDEFLWKRMSQERITSIKTSQNAISLLPPKLDIFTEEDNIERELRNSLLNYRKGKFPFKFQAKFLKLVDNLVNLMKN